MNILKDNSIEPDSTIGEVEVRAVEKRILEISHRRKLSHLGSCLTMVRQLLAIHRVKRDDEPLILSNGHSALALYCVNEFLGGRNAEEAFDHHGVHPDRCRECGIDCSSGSLGQGFPIAVGMALAKRYRNVWVTTSDGEWAEGSMWEAIRIVSEKRLMNLKVTINFNGYSAYSPVYREKILSRMNGFGVSVISVENASARQLVKSLERTGTTVLSPTFLLVGSTYKRWPFLNGIDAHYHVLTEEEYVQVL